MKFIASVSMDHRAIVNEVANQLKKNGIKINSVLPITGIITGEAKTLTEVKIVGIDSVEEDKKISL